MKIEDASAIIDAAQVRFAGEVITEGFTEPVQRRVLIRGQEESSFTLDLVAEGEDIRLELSGPGDNIDQLEPVSLEDELDILTGDAVDPLEEVGESGVFEYEVGAILEVPRKQFHVTYREGGRRYEHRNIPPMQVTVLDKLDFLGRIVVADIGVARQNPRAFFASRFTSTAYLSDGTWWPRQGTSSL